MDVIIISIEWEKFPYSDETFKKVQNDTGGLYQIYGYHPAYGDNALLYIGKTGDKFASRLNGRRQGINESAVMASFVHLGTIDNYKKNWDYGWEKNDQTTLTAIRGIAEKMLIKAHPPALNTQEIKGFFSKEEIEKFNQTVKREKNHFLIINWFEFGRLSPEISTLRMSYYCWDDKLN